MSRSLAGVACCCVCPPDECRLPCLFQEIQFTATGTLTWEDTFYGCLTNGYDNKTASMNFQVRSLPLINNIMDVNVPTGGGTLHRTNVDTSNIYAAGRFTGGFTIQALGSYQRSQRSPVYFPPGEPGGLYDVIETSYNISWSALSPPGGGNVVCTGTLSTTDIFVHDKKPGLVCEDEGCFTYAYQCRNPSNFSVLSVPYTETWAGSVTVTTFRDDTGDIFEIGPTTSISETFTQEFPLGHLHVITKDPRLDCQDEYDPYYLLEALGNSYMGAMFDSTQYPLENIYSPVTDDICDGQGEPQPLTRRTTVAGAEIIGPCSDSQTTTSSKIVNGTVTVRSVITQLEADNCPTP